MPSTGSLTLASPCGTSKRPPPTPTRAPSAGTPRRARAAVMRRKYHHNAGQRRCPEQVVLAKQEGAFPVPGNVYVSGGTGQVNVQAPFQRRRWVPEVSLTVSLLLEGRQPEVSFQRLRSSWRRTGRRAPFCISARLWCPRPAPAPACGRTAHRHPNVLTPTETASVQHALTGPSPASHTAMRGCSGGRRITG